MPTRSGWLVAVGSVAALATGRLFGVLELFVLGAMGLVALLLALAWVRRPVAPLTTSRRITPPRLSVGALGRVEVRVANPSGRPLSFLTLVDPVEHTVGARLVVGRLGRGAVRELGYRIPTTRRGLLHIGPLTAELTDPFGLARRALPGAGPATVTVLPEIEVLTDVPMGTGRHEPLAGLSLRAHSSNGLEDLATLRPYVVGDDLRRVHWPSTARSGELQVRRDEEQWQGHLTVVLDARGDALDEDGFERAVSTCAGLVHAAGESGDRVRLCFTDGTDSGMVDGRRGAGALLELLALVEQHADHTWTLPLPDPRAQEAAVLVTGRSEPAELCARLQADGYAQVHVQAVAASGRRW